MRPNASALLVLIGIGICHCCGGCYGQQKHASVIYDLSFSSDGKRIAVIRNDATARPERLRVPLRDWSASAAVVTLGPPHVVSFLPASGALDFLNKINDFPPKPFWRSSPTIRFVDGDTGLAILDHQSGMIAVYNFHLATAKRLESIGEIGRMCVSDEGTALIRFGAGVRRFLFRTMQSTDFPALDDDFARSSPCPEGASTSRDLVVTIGPRKLNFWRISSGQIESSIDTSPCSGNLRAVAVDWSGARVAVATTESSAIFSMDGKFIAGLNNSTSIFNIAVSGNADQVAILNGSVVEIYSLVTGKYLGGPDKYSEPIYSLAYSPDGEMLATGHQTYVMLWDTRTWKSLGQIAIQPQ